AQDKLQSGALGYGILTSCIGAGAMIGAMSLPFWRRRLNADQIVSRAAVVFAATLLTMAWAPHWLMVVVMLVVAGMAWTSTTPSLNVAVQTSVAPWVQARSLGMYQMTFQGGMAIGSALWGSVAEHFGTTVALSTAATGMLLTLTVARRLPLTVGTTLDYS